MIELLTKPGFQKRALPLSVKAWHGMIAEGLAPKRAELIRGVIVEKISKSSTHVLILDALVDCLKSRISDSYWVRQEAPITLADSEPETDISVVEKRYKKQGMHHPTTAKLVVEIAVTTLEDDRDMAEVYAEEGVEEYWIVNARAQNIEVYRQPSPTGYLMREIVGHGTALCSAALPEVQVNVSQLFAGLSEVV